MSYPKLLTSKQLNSTYRFACWLECCTGPLGLVNVLVVEGRWDVSAGQGRQAGPGLGDRLDKGDRLVWVWVTGWTRATGWSGSGWRGMTGWTRVTGWSGSGWRGMTGWTRATGWSGWTGVSGWAGSGWTGTTGWSGWTGVSGWAGSGWTRTPVWMGGTSWTGPCCWRFCILLATRGSGWVGAACWMGSCTWRFGRLFGGISYVTVHCPETSLYAYASSPLHPLQEEERSLAENNNKWLNSLDAVHLRVFFVVAVVVVCFVLLLLLLFWGVGFVCVRLGVSRLMLPVSTKRNRHFVCECCVPWRGRMRCLQQTLNRSLGELTWAWPAATALLMDSLITPISLSQGPFPSLLPKRWRSNCP